MTPELWKLVGETITQLISFVIFFWIMKKYAWKPLLNVLDERQKTIEGEFEDIRQKQEKIDRMRSEYEAHLEKIEAEAREKIQEAVNEGRRVAAELTESARNETITMKEQARHNIELEINKARVELRNNIVNMTVDASERLIREKMDSDSSRRLVNAFIQDLENRSN
jgi:F-type H+-transporting ATPase subunit b